MGREGQRRTALCGRPCAVTLAVRRRRHDEAQVLALALALTYRHDEAQVLALALTYRHDEAQVLHCEREAWPGLESG